MVGVNASFVPTEVIEGLFGDRPDERFVNKAMSHHLATLALTGQVDASISGGVQTAGPLPAWTCSVDPVGDRAEESAPS